jgi:hypothetical protein
MDWARILAFVTGTVDQELRNLCCCLFVRGVPKGQSSLFFLRFLIDVNYPAYPGIMAPLPSEPKCQHKRAAAMMDADISVSDFAHLYKLDPIYASQFAQG